jgi:uncharacterized membrane protein YhaH (DUF805 family)
MKQLFQEFFRGSLNRRTFLFADAALGVAAILVQTIRERPASLETASGVAIYVFAILLVFATMSLTIRRLHDIGRSGWLVLFTYLPVVNIVLAVYTLVKKGEPGSGIRGLTALGRRSTLSLLSCLLSEETRERPPPP